LDSGAGYGEAEAACQIGEAAWNGGAGRPISWKRSFVAVQPVVESLVGLEAGGGALGDAILKRPQSFRQRRRDFVRRIGRAVEWDREG
jgi:hypothetical protein